MPEKYVPIGKMYIAGNEDRPQLSYWDGDRGLADPLIKVGQHVYDLPGKLLCNVEDAPDPEATALERIATALERIAAAMEAGSVGGANHTLSYFASADALIASLQPGG